MTCLRLVGSIGFISLILIPSAVVAQTGAQSSGRIVMVEREGIEGRSTWSLNVSAKTVQGTGVWDSGEIASLVVTSAKVNKDNSVDLEIHRVDKDSDLTADYHGTWRDGRIGGEYTYALPGQPPKTENWFAMTEPPVTLPATMHFCDVNCGTFELHNGRYVNVSRPPYDDPGFSDTWEVLSFTRDNVKFRRTLTGQYHFTVTYSGKIVNDHLSGAANPFHGPGQPDTIMVAWGNDMKNVPGQGHPFSTTFSQATEETPEERLADKQIVIAGLKVWAALLNSN